MLGGNPAVLVSHGFWREQLGSRPDLAGLTLKFGNRTYAVVGVMPPEFPSLSGSSSSTAMTRR
jgi:hypothetical protein